MTSKICPASILLFALLLVPAATPFCTASTVYVRPENDHAQCPGKICYPLSHYQQNVSHYFVSDTTVVFMNGTHLLQASQQLVIQNIENFTMKGTGGFIAGLENLYEPSSRIECNGTRLSGLKFINVTRLQIENLTVACCGHKVLHNNDIHAAVALDTAHSVTFSRVTVRNSSGFGLHADKVFGYVRVYESAFLYNTGNKEYYGGNARFWYGECPEDHNAYLEIESSYFLHGYDTLKL